MVVRHSGQTAGYCWMPASFIEKLKLKE